jgi:hypothetical protein
MHVSSFYIVKFKVNLETNHDGHGWCGRAEPNTSTTNAEPPAKGPTTLFPHGRSTVWGPLKPSILSSDTDIIGPTTDPSPCFSRHECSWVVTPWVVTPWPLEASTFSAKKRTDPLNPEKQATAQLLGSPKTLEISVGGGVPFPFPFASEASIIRSGPFAYSRQRRVRDAPQHHHRGAISIPGSDCRVGFRWLTLDLRSIRFMCLRRWFSIPFARQARSGVESLLRMAKSVSIGRVWVGCCGLQGLGVQFKGVGVMLWLWGLFVRGVPI